ncbi:unnamed protein product [Bursaphelenchus okinawaensis]|uniref:BPI2 domain-containing protein n=1 Tax=Bursaphelenchus okinawaensis TaxID=465554 RepID=A0A811JQ57_9BILA|nr:unnamed protein product [Bursaphelenchus okinawaensis]CAG9076979.1 unnamed protein product [Bursaphelenchus okinawaensis]
MGLTSIKLPLLLATLLCHISITAAHYAQQSAYGPAVPQQSPVTYNLQPVYQQPQAYQPSQGYSQIVQPYGAGGALSQAGGSFGQAGSVGQGGSFGQSGSFGQPALNGEANIVNAAGVSGGSSSALAGGIPGGPGIRFRVNKPAFRYAGEMIAPILSNQIRNARIPGIHQCLPQVDGCIRVDNIFISNYQCPERIQIRPAAPNQVLIVVKNANFQVTGNLAGKVTVLAPLALGGQFVATAQGISISVGLTVQRSATGGLNVAISSCHATVGYIGLQIINGGTLGELASSPTFSQKISRAMKKILPPRVCAQLPQILNQQVNSRLGNIPMSIPLTKILEVAGGALKTVLGDDSAPKAECPAECKEGASSSSDAGTSSNDAGVEGGSSSDVNSQLSASPPPADPPSRGYGSARASKTHKTRVSRVTGRVKPRSPRTATQLQRPLRASPRSSTLSRHVIQAAQTVKRQVDCTPCNGGGGGDTASFLTTFTKSLDMSKLNDLQLSLGLLNTYASSQDFVADLQGEFSPNAVGGTPFSPFPLQFPAPQGPPRMVEGLVSDYTINSLLYWLHQKQFINIRIGPDTPKIGDILKTTCSDDEDEGLEDHGVELDDGTGSSTDIALRKVRAKRQDDDGGSLADLGICLGDILPAVREEHPNEKIEIVVKSSEAPTVVLSDGKARVTLKIDADLYIQSSQEKVGTIAVNLIADVEASTANGRLSGTATIDTLDLKDKEQTLGLTQEALDNLAGLGKDFVEKAINDALSKGISLNIPPGIGGLPVSFQNPDFRIIDHALYVAADLSVDPAGLAPLLAQQGLSLTPDQCGSRNGRK